jgi:hypothetical protein
MVETKNQTVVEKKGQKNRGIGCGSAALGGAAGALGALLLFGAGSCALNNGRETSNPTAGASNSPTAIVEMATPTASQAASGSPKLEVQSFHLVAGDKMAVLPGDVIVGDVTLSDTDCGSAFPLYDTDTHKAADVQDNTKTALYVDVEANGEVYAGYGGDVIRGLSGDAKTSWLNNQKIDKVRSGFTKVDVVDWTGYSSTKDEAGQTAAQQNLPQLGLCTLPGASSSPESGASSSPEATQTTPCCNICGAPTPTPEATCGCATPTKTPEGPCTPMEDTIEAAGKTIKTNGESFIVEGDVTIDGVKHFDNSSSTGAIDKVTDGKSHTILFNYQGDFQKFNSCATGNDIQNTYDKDKTALNNSGRSLDGKSLTE